MDTVQLIVLSSDLFLFDAFRYLAAGVLVGPEQADDAGFIGVQDVPVCIPDHKIQL